MTTVYISDCFLYVVTGKAGRETCIVHSVNKTIIPNGLLSSGVIVDAEGFSSFLSHFWQEHKFSRKHVTLVLEGITNKTLEAPEMKCGTLIKYLSREFVDYGRNKDEVFGCWTIERNKQCRRSTLLVMAAKRSNLRMFIDTFSAANIRLQEICSSITGILLLLKQMKTLRQTCIVQYWNGESLLNLLLIDGRYIYSTTNHIPYQSGTQGFAVSIARQINQLLQFIKAQQLSRQVEQVYLAGISNEDMAMCMESIAQVGMKLTVEELPAIDAPPGITLYGSLAAIGALMLKPDQMGLLRQTDSDIKCIWEERKRCLFPVAVLAICEVLLCVGLRIFQIRADLVLRELWDYNMDGDIVRIVSKYDELEEKNALLCAQIAALEADHTSLESYPLPNSKANDEIILCAQGLATVKVKGYRASSGVISMEITVDNVENISKFIAALSKRRIFSAVHYTGFNFDSKINKWIVHVTCILSGEAGR